MREYQGFIDAELPRPIRSLFPRMFQLGYSAVSSLAKDTKFLTIPTTLNALGHLRVVAVEHAIVQAINEGLINIDYDWADFSKPTGKYLRLRTKNSLVTISQLAHRAAFPRRAIFRENARLNNQLLFDFEEFKKEMRLQGVAHLVLGHGYHELYFLNVNVPHPTKSHWLYQSRNLLTELHEVVTGLPPIEQPDENQLGRLKEELLRKLQPK